MINQHSLDPSACPLCGKPNACKKIEGHTQNDLSCWCKLHVFPEKLLHKLSEEDKTKTCICESCVRKADD